MKLASFPADFSKLASDPSVCKPLLARLTSSLSGRRMRFMEVCGTHTVAIFRSGLRSLLPENVVHLSGPGCPVCVTHEADLALLLEAARQPGVLIASFGDLLRVPGPSGVSLNHMRARGALIETVYSPLDAVALAQNNPDKIVVFAGIGFETTAPAVASAILAASAIHCPNFTVLSMHKLIPPALQLLLQEEENVIDAFLLPGHVATITGLEPFEFIPLAYGKAAAVGGFEPADILQALCVLADQSSTLRPSIANCYRRAVADKGNEKARSIMERVFQRCDARWRGLGKIPESGLCIREEFADYDAIHKLALEIQEAETSKGCQCGNMLKGMIEPPQCPLFAKKCTPANPLGPCMVSTEGSCSAWYKYGRI